jgi:hypothetical protein
MSLRALRMLDDEPAPASGPRGAKTETHAPGESSTFACGALLGSLAVDGAVPTCNRCRIVQERAPR